jgi:hypothetical protein
VEPEPESDSRRWPSSMHRASHRGMLLKTPNSDPVIISYVVSTMWLRESVIKPLEPVTPQVISRVGCRIDAPLTP